LGQQSKIIGQILKSDLALLWCSGGEKELTNIQLQVASQKCLSQSPHLTGRAKIEKKEVETCPT